MKNIAWKQLEDKFKGLVDIRRNLHMYPELSFEEVKTPAMFEIRIKGRDGHGSMPHLAIDPNLK
jgi:metal-dependent amidase/aminoacylase/carboxypeptidase family protein